MMKIGLNAAGAVALFASLSLLTACQKREVAEVEPEPEVPATPVPTATPTPPPRVVAATPTPVPDPLAPPGVYYLLTKHSITTEEGITGLRPGQVLQQIAPGTYQVGAHTVQLRDDQVTNNLRIAGQFAAADASALAAIRQNVVQQNAAAAAAARVTPTPAPVKAPSAGARPQPPTTRTGSSLGGSSSLGSTHTKTQGGWLYQRTENGTWVPVRPLGN